ncbi:hypothetical protein EAW55_00595 [Legionella jordanis]|nr:hypothetical protein EAW55_00595 [Legionella jordanis]RMX20952.1 hypothetical protein EAS68_06445 [Legionella jordanis]
MEFMMKLKAYLISLLLFPLSHPLLAEDNGLGLSINQSPSSVQEYWTPERLKNAKEMPIPRVSPQDIQENSQKPLDEKPQFQDAVPPAEGVKPSNTILFTPDGLEEIPAQKKQFNYGSSGYNFTSSRLIPSTANSSFPYSTVGKLFFTIPGQGDYVCSASVIAKRVVLTAGHCVHSGSGGLGGYFMNFTFIPAYRNGAAPFLSWTATYVLTTPSWSTGGGTVPNAADYAMLEVADQTFMGTLRSISYLTGALGWQTNSLIPNHSHLLGYPCNFDSCQEMHQVTAQSARWVSPNNVEYGSDMQGGSSGGPWVQNFGIPSTGQGAGYNPAPNRVVGVTSYGYVNTAIMLQGSSILDTRFVSLLNSLCAHQSGNC